MIKDGVPHPSQLLNWETLISHEFSIEVKNKHPLTDSITQFFRQIIRGWVLGWFPLETSMWELFLRCTLAICTCAEHLLECFRLLRRATWSELRKPSVLCMPGSPREDTERNANETHSGTCRPYRCCHVTRCTVFATWKSTRTHLKIVLTQIEGFVVYYFNQTLLDNPK